MLQTIAEILLLIGALGFAVVIWAVMVVGKGEESKLGVMAGIEV